MGKITARIKTMQDMEAAFYGGQIEMEKAMAPIISSTTGVYQAVFGAKVWVNLNQEANLAGILPKKVWEKSGERLITARAAATGGGYTENAALPDTIKPTFNTYSQKPKTIVHTFDVSETAQFLSGVDDGLGDAMKVMREQIGTHHAEMMNIMLGTDNDTLAGTNLESLDRICGSYSEITGCGQTAGDLDIFGLDRDAAASFADAQVSHNSNTDRPLELTLLNAEFNTIWKAKGKPKVLATGYETLTAINELMEPQRYFMNAAKVVPTYNGIEGVQEGVEGGFYVATYNGIPIIVSKDVCLDTLPRIYFLDTDYLWMKVAKPTQYFEEGISKGNPFAVNRAGDEGMYRTMMEPTCPFLGAQGKIRDLK